MVLFARFMFVGVLYYNMLRVSAPNDARTFTSGRGTDSTFRIDIQGDFSEYRQLRIEADLEGYDEEDIAGDSNNVIAIEYVSRGQDVPCEVYLPASTSRVQPSFQVYRGPLHPHEIDLFEVELVVYGGDGDEENWERIGSDTMELRG